MIDFIYVLEKTFVQGQIESVRVKVKWTAWLTFALAMHM